MPTYERVTRVPAPLEAVWAFHSTPDGLRELTPDWLHLRVDSIEGPERNQPKTLHAGTELHLSVQPLGIGPRQRWVSAITERSRGDGVARFRDEMRDGPLPKWVHTHSFYAAEEQTILHDHVEYSAGLPAALETLFKLAFELGFRYRHRRVTALFAAQTSPVPGESSDSQ